MAHEPREGVPARGPHADPSGRRVSAAEREVLAPSSEEEAAAVVATCAGAGRRLSIRGGGTRTGLGRPATADAILSAARLSGIVFHAPSEMVICAGAGTPLADIEAALATHGQQLAFEPMDHRVLLASTGAPTIGAVASANVSGPRRINGGAARDSLIGIRLVNGRGEIVKSGGRVMKNVTGLDLVKLVSGAYGTLGFLTEVTFKVLPKAEQAATLVIHGLDDVTAIAALSAALGSPFEPTGAAHLPAGMDWSGARTLIRVEGFSDSVTYRLDAIGRLVAAGHRTERIDGTDSEALWRNVRDAAYLADPHSDAVWRISTAPTRGPEVTAAISRQLPGARWFYDWGGGLVWLSTLAAGDAGAGVIRAAMATTGGHATLVRAPDAVRAAVPVFQPLDSVSMRLTEGIKASFDPEGVFEPGRMYLAV
ncbi:MAG: FAD-binding protein [Bauldia sp.]|nr:FAD-binding protein [Bauldia sp.]